MPTSHKIKCFCDKAEKNFSQKKAEKRDYESFKIARSV